LAKVTSALFCSKRETDAAGWYHGGAVLGVIFAEIDDAGAGTPQVLIRTRLTAALRATLDAKLVDRIQISFHLFPDDWKQGNPGPWQDSELYPDLVEREDARKVPLSIKRMLDIAGSLAALVLGAPVMIAIAVAVKFTSKGPILFKQERVGWRGSRFVFLKFRSMKCANDPTIHREYVRRFIAGKADSAPTSENPKAVYKIQDDPRVTRVGRFLRKTSLDELPQFINVLRGEMSLVGPRPPIPYELEHYRVWHRRRVLEAKPGITGLWQVNGRSRLKFDDMVRLDLRYAGTWSLRSDLKVLLQTPRAALFCKGAY
jgi:lipopolysaccharide/colanic/teichoic acid biosynthesis glycosyltransferase